jgi:hypothetical protein
VVKESAKRRLESVQRGWRNYEFTGPDKAAVALVGLSIAVWGAWHWRQHLPHSTFIEDWAPNVGADFFGIALTIAIIDRIVRSHEHRRIRPLVERAHADMWLALETFAYAAAVDYAATHDATYQDQPVEISAVFEHWLNGVDSIDVDPPPGSAGVLDAAEELANRLDDTRAAYMDVLDPALLIAADNCARELREARGWVNAAGLLHLTEDPLVLANARAVEPARRFSRDLESASGGAVTSSFFAETVAALRHFRAGAAGNG